MTPDPMTPEPTPPEPTTPEPTIPEPTPAEPTTMVVSDADIAATILDQATLLGIHKSLSPSDVALVLANSLGQPDWRRHLGPVRRVAIGLAKSGAIDILRKGRPVDPVGVRGVIRLRIRTAPPNVINIVGDDSSSDCRPETP